MSTRLSAAEWRNRTEQDLNDLQRRTNTLQERHVDPDELESIAGRLKARADWQEELLGTIQDTGVDKGEQAARLIGQMRGRTSENKAAVDDLRNRLAALEAARDAAPEVLPPEAVPARVAAAMQGAALNGADPQVGLQNGVDRGLFDNLWRFSGDWRPLARPLHTAREAALGGVVRAIGENAGMEAAHARRLEQAAAVGLTGVGAFTAVSGLSALMSPEAQQPVQAVYVR